MLTAADPSAKGRVEVANVGTGNVLCSVRQWVPSKLRKDLLVYIADR